MKQSTVYARVGIAGNPSDGFYGKTVSSCIKNWKATVMLEPCDRIVIQPNPVMDKLEFTSLSDLADHSDRYGYYGALRLIHAGCSLFYKRTKREIEGFRISYASNIPRQVGLGGSSALVVALLNCLYQLHNESVSLSERAHLAWSVENEELGITAGLQDRVVQTYGGLVYMDFAQIERTGHGKYERLSCILPPSFIAYTEHPRKDSGTVHNPIRTLFHQKDLRVLSAMSEFASYAERAKEAILAGSFYELSKLMNYNWLLRRDLYGESVGEDNVKMIEIANENNCVAKLPGSGGAVIGLYGNQYEALKEDYEREGYKVVKVEW